MRNQLQGKLLVRQCVAFSETNYIMFENDTCSHYEFPMRFVKRTREIDKNFIPEVCNFFFCTQLTVKIEYKLNVTQVL